MRRPGKAHRAVTSISRVMAVNAEVFLKRRETKVLDRVFRGTTFLLSASEQDEGEKNNVLFVSSVNSGSLYLKAGRASGSGGLENKGNSGGL